MEIVKRYFYIQQLTFAAIGIDPRAMSHQWQAEHNPRIVKHRVLFVVPMFLAALQYTAMFHYVCVNASDYIEVADTLIILCQGFISVMKMLIFMFKRREIVQLVRHVKMENLKAQGDELSIVRRENAKDVLFCTIYFSVVVGTAFCNLLPPIVNAVFVYVARGETDLRVAQKATYFWNHQHVQGYSLVYIWNIFTVYSLICVSVAIDSLFSWLVCNIVAQFHILLLRLEKASVAASASTDDHDVAIALDVDSVEQAIIDCIKFHTRTLQLTHELNRLYGGIIFVKFIISGTQICCLAFCLSRGNQPFSILAYQCMFLSAVALQLILYCFNGQRIKDESLQVASQIYAVFQWSHLAKSTKKLLLMPMMRSQKFSQLRGVFFTVDLSLYLWVFKTAGSLIAVLKTLVEDID